MATVEFEPGSHTYGIDGKPVPSVTQILEVGGFIDKRWFTAFARERGSAVHRAIEFSVKGTLNLNSIDPKIQGYLNAWDAFVEEYRYEPIACEKIVYSVSQQYAGTLDHSCMIRGHNSIVDVKTGKLEPVVGLQLTGYADALKEMTGAFVSKLYGVQLNVDGTFNPKLYVADFPTWRGAVRGAWWKRENQ